MDTIRKKASSKKLDAHVVRHGTEPGNYFDNRRTGLFLRIRKDGGKQWVQRLTINGRLREIGLGRCPDVSLSEARDTALENQLEARQGIDPVTSRQMAAREHRWKSGFPTFEELARQRHAELLPSFKNGTKHGQLWINTLVNYAFPHIGDWPVNEVKARHIKDLLMANNLWQEKPETARRVRQRIGDVMREAVTLDYRDDNPTAALNMPPQKKKPVPMKSLPYAEVPAAVRMIREKSGWPPVRLALEFQILTAMRPGEVRHARWSEIDTSDKVWAVPAERMKMPRDHIVPLSERCLEILDEAGGYAGDEGLVFPNRGRDKPLSDMTLSKAMRDLNVNAVPHGFRSSFRTWAQERTETPREVAEAALAHANPNQVEAVYARSDYLEKRRPLMQAWADYISYEPEQRVVSLKR